ncbi:MAG: hypothetical protein JW873_05230 [Candidatus Saganbacteria bacterium]|nr:hypothetical protein [Candidatus Saganbacteria bacterium]
MDNMCVDPYAKVGGSSSLAMRVTVKNADRARVCGEAPTNASESFVADVVNTPITIAVIGRATDIEAVKSIILGDYPVEITAPILDQERNNLINTIPKTRENDFWESLGGILDVMVIEKKQPKPITKNWIDPYLESLGKMLGLDKMHGRRLNSPN